jgi:hypothetical protein
MAKPEFPEVVASGRSLFPETAPKPNIATLCGLKIVEVVTTMHDSVKVIHALDSNEESHSITFRSINSSCVGILLDDVKVLDIETEV